MTCTKSWDSWEKILDNNKIIDKYFNLILCTLENKHMQQIWRIKRYIFLLKRFIMFIISLENCVSVTVSVQNESCNTMQKVSRISLARRKSCLSLCTNVRLNVCKTNFLSVKIIVSKQGRVSNFQDLIFNVQLDEIFIMYYSPFFPPQ